jgi:polyvinyl alcohol dehydrogenase (cytochrome)
VFDHLDRSQPSVYMGAMTRWVVVGVLAGLGCSSSSAPPEDWPMYGRTLQHSFATTSTSIDRHNVGSLEPAWSFPVTDAVTASPTVVGGVVYVGAWDGFFYALDARTGAVSWRFQLDCQPTILPIPTQCLAPGQTEPDRTDTDGGIVTSSAAVDSGVVFFGGGKTLYALDASTGALVWKTVICGNPDEPSCESDAQDPDQIFASPVVFDGKVIVGHSVDAATGYRGGMSAYDAATGAQVWWLEIDPLLGPEGTVVGGQNRGCGNVWSTAAIDEAAGLAYIGTADCQTDGNDATPPYHEALLALDLATGNPDWVFRPRTTDVCDLDFGATPNLIEYDDRRYVGIGGKDGTYYLMPSGADDPTNQPVWQTNVVFGGTSGGFIGTPAFDGKHIFGGTGLGELGSTPCEPSNPRDSQLQDPSFHALAIEDGSVAWELSKAYSFGATTIANDVVFNGVGSVIPDALNAYGASDGATLLALSQPGAVNSSATIWGDMIFFGTGNSFDGQGGSVQAYKLP